MSRKRPACFVGDRVQTFNVESDELGRLAEKVVERKIR